MSQPGGGAEAHARSKQYEYRANSSLVLTTDSRPRDTNEPSGEPETLWGKIDPKEFGDRALRKKDPELKEKIEKSKKKKKEREAAVFDAVPPKSKKRRLQEEEESVLSFSDEGVYCPRTKETRAAYEVMLSIIQQQLGGQPLIIVSCAADEILAVLKNDGLDNAEKKREIEKLLNAISGTTFDQLVAYGRLITDYVDASGDGDDGVAYGDDGLDEDVGVAVEFEENEEEEESDLDMVQEDEEDEDDLVTGRSKGMQMGGMDDDEEQEANEGMSLNVQDVDAYWLQRKISQAHDQQIDPQQSQKLAEEILKILAEGGDDRDIETNLLVHLDFKYFDLIKYLLRNRLKIVWCTRLARAEDENQRKETEEEMKGLGPGHTAILEQLHATRATAKERQKNVEKSIREEARRLRDETAVDGDHELRGLVDRDPDSGWLDGQRQLLDLDSLAFREGALLNANKSCLLPEGSFRNPKKGYEEVHIPALKPRPMGSDEKLVKILELPDWAQPAFSGMSQLNRVQSKVYQSALFTADNLLLCAPTGAGKTNVAMLTILQQIGLNRNDDGSISHSNYKIVYVAPMKALVTEVVGNLSKRLDHYGVKVKELSGDQSLTRQQIEETQIIVTTPEKWDIITRKSGDRTYTQHVKLLIIDEIHLLHDDRGPVLESIIARTVRQIETTKEHIRLVGLSATLPNYEDVATFLRVDLKQGLFHFDNSYRPVPLAQQYIGITVKKPLQRFQLMNEVCYEKVISIAGKHQVLIFVHSRKETSKTGRAIRDSALANDTLSRFLREDSASREILQSQTDLVKNNDLKDLLPYGFAIHHAGMDRADREIVEELFADGHVQVLVSTATLAWGVNLPAHTVIIKGTQVYSPDKGAWTELSPLNIMQMLGRAGRPQYDTYGEGIIITGHSELQYYLSLMNQQLPIESQFISKLADQLNAEIVLGTVQNAREACKWLLYTYLVVRMIRNPTLYGLAEDIRERDPTLEERRADLIHSAATLLDKNNLVKYDRKSGCFQVTDLGRIASYYYITHGTISTFNEHLKPTMSDIELCRLFSLSEEFKYVTVRQDEKIELAKLLEKVPIPVKESLEEPSSKINVLLQAYISRLKLEGLSLSSDMVFITQSAGRLMRALFEIVLKRGWAQPADKALKLCKMIGKRMWSVQTPLRQFNILGDILNKLEKKDLAWERYYDLKSHQIGELIHYPKVGRTVYNHIHQFPKLILDAQVQPITRSILKVELTIIPDFNWDDKVHGYVEPFWIIVEDNDGECILHHEYFMLKKQYIGEDHTISFTVPMYEPLPPQYFINVISDRWLGAQYALPVSFRHLILPEKYPPPTELLDLQPLPVTALRNPAYEALYQQFKHFNPVQTQVFTILYNSDDNVLVAAPTGSGKTICAEFAILRNHQNGPDSVMRAVYVAPVEALAKERYNDWKKKFGDGLGMRVVELTGETATDLKLLQNGQIIITTPEKWDALSRRWKQRKLVQQVSLFIIDELHLIGGQGGPVLEVIVSRMRYIASQLDNKIRIVALSTSLANAKDLGEWIGATSHGLFNFPPGVRPVPLEIYIQGIDIANFEARMLAMTKPTYTAIVQHAKNSKPAVVFVPTRKHARLIAVDLMTYSSLDSDEKPMFLLQSAEELEPIVNRIQEPMLKETIQFGVGYLHEGLSSADQDIVKTLFGTGCIQVCVISSSMCWGVSLSAHLVVVMGTQYYDGRENAHTDYPVTELLQMMGHASRPLVDNSGKCVILCHAPRKEYYKKFLYEAFPVESHLHHYLHDNINAEVVARVIQNKQEAVDYLTWTFMYRRLTQNPNYYNLQGVSHRHLSDHLSDLVENTVSALKESKCVAVEEDDVSLSPLNLGMIASYYYISYTTIERFSSSLTSKTKLRGLLEILSSASEYELFPLRPGEEDMIRKLINHLRFSFENPNYTDPHVKANALLQAHFSRQAIGGNLASDQHEVLVNASRLLQAMVDVISSSGWLSLALLAMEVNQMVTQGMWERDSMLLQLPHFTKELAKRCQENSKSIETVFDLVEMEDDERRELLQMPDSQLMDIARFCNRFPNIELNYEVPGSDNVIAGEDISVHVSLERDLEGRTEVGPVDAPRYPKSRVEGWWLVVGDTMTNQLLAIKRVTLQRKSSVKLDFTAPAEPGKKSYTLYLMCDSYLGCDQEYNFIIDVKEDGEMATEKND